MPYSLFKKYGLFFCLLLCINISSIVHAQPLFLGYENLSLSLLNDYSSVNVLWLSLYVGALLALLSYNFLLFLSLRSISHLYYVLLTGTILLAFGAFNGLWFSVLWPNSPQWHDVSLPIGLLLAGLFSIQFSRSCLSTSSQSPKLDKFFYRLSLAFGLTLLTTLFTPLVYISYLTTLLIIILCFTALVASVKTCLQGNRASQIHLMAWLILLFGISLSLTHQFGWLSNQWLAHYALALSTLFFVLLLSLVLTYRIIITRSQTIQFHKKMVTENKTQIAAQVSEQTQELTQLNEKLKQQERVLKKLAFYDSLTGIANQTFIQEQLKQLLTHSRRNKTKITVLLLDIDDFKRINNEHGHKTGDEVLITIANRLVSTLRENDVVGRLGCNKFIVLLESSAADEHDPQEVAKKIRNALIQTISMDWFILHLHASIGVASFPDDGRDVEELIDAANSAMQIEKSNK